MGRSSIIARWRHGVCTGFGGNGEDKSPGRCGWVCILMRGPGYVLPSDIDAGCSECGIRWPGAAARADTDRVVARRAIDRWDRSGSAGACLAAAAKWTDRKDRRNDDCAERCAGEGTDGKDRDAGVDQRAFAPWVDCR